MAVIYFGLSPTEYRGLTVTEWNALTAAWNKAHRK